MLNQSDLQSRLTEAVVTALQRLKYDPPDLYARIAYLTAKNDWQALAEIGVPVAEALIAGVRQSHYSGWAEVLEDLVLKQADTLDATLLYQIVELQDMNVYGGGAPHCAGVYFKIALSSW